MQRLEVNSAKNNSTNASIESMTDYMKSVMNCEIQMKDNFEVDEGIEFDILRVLTWSNEEIE